MESEAAYDGKYFYIVVMDGPMEHDYISDVEYKYTTGLTFDTDLYFAGSACDWGDIPNFLDPPSSSERQSPVTISLRPTTNLVIRGWAVDG
ncbi:MAG: hypothetical protein OK455_06465, partial [Thaumarchaeota archaeon]|nr:hypothetical protein [Nitrososphaerota archaeon]